MLWLCYPMIKLPGNSGWPGNHQPLGQQPHAVVGGDAVAVSVGDTLFLEPANVA
jgi:hypothetical protein